MKSQTERESVKQHKIVPKQGQSRRQSQQKDETLPIADQLESSTHDQTRKSSKSKPSKLAEAQLGSRNSSKINYSVAKSQDKESEALQPENQKPVSKSKKRPPILDIQIGDISFDKIREKLTAKTTQEKKSIDFNPVRLPNGIQTSRSKIQSNLVDQIQALVMRILYLTSQQDETASFCRLEEKPKTVIPKLEKIIRKLKIRHPITE